MDYLFIENPLKQALGGRSTGAIAQFARTLLDERLRKIDDDNKKVSKEVEPQKHRDFLSRFLEAKERHPNVVDNDQVFSYTVSNVNAGSDTTAISLRAVMYYTLKDQRVTMRLQQELEQAYNENRLSPPASWTQAQSLPYLDAVIKEALRLHPAVGLLLERIVPEEGLQLPNGGPFIPPGTIVGVNPWVIHRHPVFGEEVDTFRPERWLQSDSESDPDFHIRKQNMIRATFTFGAGPRTCIGKNISLLEIYKLIPSLFLKYQACQVYQP